MEQLRKEMENLKICILKKSEDRPTVLGIRTDSAYGAIVPNMIGRNAMSSRRLNGGILSTIKEIGSIQWILGSHSVRTSEKAA